MEKDEIALEYLKILKTEIDNRAKMEWQLEAVKLVLCGSLFGIMGTLQVKWSIIIAPFLASLLDIGICLIVTGIFHIAYYIRNEIEEKCLNKSVNKQFILWETYIEDKNKTTRGFIKFFSVYVHYITTFFIFVFTMIFLFTQINLIMLIIFCISYIFFYLLILIFSIYMRKHK